MRDLLRAGRFLPLLVVGAVCALSAHAGNPPGFIDDYDLAVRRSAETERPILVVFSGSDWCYWCKKLDEEFLRQPAFTAAVTNDIILLYVDSPRDTSILSEKARKANPGLVEKYGVKGFPSMMFLYGAQGRYVGEVKRRNMSPGDWGKYLADSARKIPLMWKYMLPWKERAQAIQEEANRRMNEINGLPMSNEAKVKAAKQVVTELKTRAEKVMKEFEKIEFPPELQSEKEKYMRNLHCDINVKFEEK